MENSGAYIAIILMMSTICGFSSAISSEYVNGVMNTPGSSSTRATSVSDIASVSSMAKMYALRILSRSLCPYADDATETRADPIASEGTIISATSASGVENIANPSDPAQ